MVLPLGDEHVGGSPHQEADVEGCLPHRAPEKNTNMYMVHCILVGFRAWVNLVFSRYSLYLYISISKQQSCFYNSLFPSVGPYPLAFSTLPQ